MVHPDHNLILYVLQIISIYNAILTGWKVKKIGYNTYEFTKKINDYPLNDFINNIVTLSIIK